MDGASSALAIVGFNLVPATLIKDRFGSEAETSPGCN